MEVITVTTLFVRHNMTKRIAILHYASPPIIGGVESMIEHQARGLTALGYPVRVISGRGAPFNPSIAVHINPLFGSTHPDVLAVKSELDTGNVSSMLHQLVERLTVALDEALADCSICIAH